MKPGEDGTEGQQVTLVKMIEGVGFYYRSNKSHLPTYQDLRKMVEEAAYYKWLEANAPHGNDQYFWFEAENELFLGHQGGYRINICDLDKPENHGFLRFWDMAIVTPDGRLEEIKIYGR